LPDVVLNERRRRAVRLREAGAAVRQVAKQCELSNLPIEVDSETSRIRAALVKSGLNSFSEAEEKLLSSRLVLRIGSDAACTPAGQAALLTAAVTGARCFGQVSVLGTLDLPLLLPLPIAAKTLAEAVAHFGASEADDRVLGRTVLIGPGNE